ncbi:hemin uptake protein HemP [Brucella tritici]|jgi:hemin uptake protein HemP|uniref:Hemin uptake protein HemP n=3 Tax=Brucella/Ochrobactrum group TaxID=2826938 RepID=A0A5C5CVZ0_9HYPH|nr:hemin uptake protein HemP [Brucella tritici]MBB4091975.1 hemin uptake protein HemP [Brucella pecoris]KAB2663452.1 hemin uptake protein HemP [Brucella tritici]KAB2673378.1 hemin uptake protein HemP [Brucella tritici]KAB2681759.1 hemin uptake protein HemP [Brucella tritici]TNV15572.1 hemin uptake protein HemP [Brucella pecoris]
MNRRIHIDMQVRLPRGPVSDRTANRIPESQLSGDSTGSVPAQIKPRFGESALEPQLKTYGSRELFDGSREVGIEHGGSLYRLKITRQGKLILNK